MKIFSGNALFRPVSSQVCRFKRYPMLSRTLPNRHGASRTLIFGFGDRHATINTTRLYFFYKHFFKTSINSFTCFCVYTTGLPSSEDMILILPDFLSFSTISQASLPYSSQPQTFAYFLLDFFITIFLLSFNIQKC